MIFYGWKNRLVRLVTKSIFLKLGKKYDVIIFDDLFPHPLSGFRNSEILYYLFNIPNSKVICSGRGLSIIHEERGIKYFIKELVHQYPSLAGKIITKSKFNFVNAKLYYCIFFGPVKNELFGLCEKFKISFGFTLYPGGGFKVRDAAVDASLIKILNSNLCKFVFVNQKYTVNYLNSITNVKKLKFIAGNPMFSKLKYKNSKNKTTDVIRIIFIAGKYSIGGEDKGFDLFVNVLDHYKFNSNIEFHLAGGFTQNDLDQRYSNLVVHGYLANDELDHLFSSMDIIVSPNRPFQLCEGCFDGFPLATVVQAGLNGVCMIATDELAENEFLTNWEDIIIIKPHKESLIDSINELLTKQNLIWTIGNNGRLKLLDQYSDESQLIPRLQVLNSHLN